MLQSEKAEGPSLHIVAGAKPGSRKPLSVDALARIALYVIVATAGGLLIWSVLAPINAAVVANGRIVVEGSREVIQHLEGGIIAEVFVQEGEVVKSGDPLIRLDDVRQTALVAQIDNQLASLYARRARLEAERDGESDLTARGVEAVLSSPTAADSLNGQRALLKARRKTKETETSVLEEKIALQEKLIASLKLQIESLHAQQTLIQDELQGVVMLNKQGYAPKTRVRALQREERRLDGQQEELKGRIGEAQSLIGETRLELNRLADRTLEDVLDEWRDVETAIASLEERRVDAADALRRTEFYAPADGRVLGLAVHSPGEVIQPGATLMEIVPDGRKLEIEVAISPSDIDRVAEGQETLIRFTAFSGRRTPEAKGVVKTVSADSLTDAKTGAHYFLVRVALSPDESLKDVLRADQHIAPGMPVEAFIRTGTQSAISYLLRPLNDAIARSMREE